MTTVTVRWNDGYREEFIAKEVRFCSDLLWIDLCEGTNRHIPLRQVRWFSLNLPDRERKADK